MTIAGEQAIQALRCFEELGVSADDLCASLGLTRSGLGGPGTRMSRVLFDSLFLAAAERSGDPLLGLHAGMARAPADLLFFLSASQGTLGEALGEYVRLIRIVAASMTARVDLRGTTAWLWVEDTAPGRPEALRHEFEYFAGQMMQYLALASRGACRPVEIRFPHPPAGPVLEYEKVLAAPVAFRWDAFELGVRAADLDTAVVTANANVARIARAEARQQLEAVESGAFRSRVEMALRRRIQEAADHSREAIAAQLGTSVGTLKRRLEAEGCSFRDVRDGVCRAVAEEMLARTEKSVSEIAELLDFADAASFGKAFRRWTGANPRQYRARTRSR